VATPGPSADEVTWSYLKDSTDLAALRRFATQFSTSPHRREADARIATLEREAGTAKVAAVPPATPPAGASKPASPDIAQVTRVPTVKVLRDQVAGLSPFTKPEGPIGAKPDAAVTQRVILYEEDTKDSKGKNFVGSATWRSQMVSPGAGKPAELTLSADIEIPERQLKIVAKFSRNNDAALPASHLVEIQFKLPNDFAGGAITNVPGILMKANGDQRGTPLAGLSVKVTDNFFLIGLSSNATDIQRNVELLKDRPTIDVPIVYGNGNRAILTIEKGATGERAFAEAFKNKGL
jgi:hypothetical protein